MTDVSAVSAVLKTGFTTEHLVCWLLAWCLPASFSSLLLVLAVYMPGLVQPALKLVVKKVSHRAVEVFHAWTTPPLTVPVD